MIEWDNEYRDGETRVKNQLRSVNHGDLLLSQERDDLGELSTSLLIYNGLGHKLADFLLFYLYCARKPQLEILVGNFLSHYDGEKIDPYQKRNVSLNYFFIRDIPDSELIPAGFHDPSGRIYTYGLNSHGELVIRSHYRGASQDCLDLFINPLDVETMVLGMSDSSKITTTPPCTIDYVVRAYEGLLNDSNFIPID